jgi:diaminopropionate ammonia-lyase
MGRLDCKEPSISAFYSLTKTANYFMHLSDHYVEGVIEYLKSLGVNTSASGGAGLAGVKYSISKNLFGISKKSNVLIFLTEGAEVL